MTWPSIDFRQVITTLIVGGFFVAFFMEPGNDTMRGALIAAFAGAWGYWLGSSQGAHENRAELREHGDKLLAAMAPKETP